MREGCGRRGGGLTGVGADGTDQVNPAGADIHLHGRKWC